MKPGTFARGLNAAFYVRNSVMTRLAGNSKGKWFKSNKYRERFEFSGVFVAGGFRE